MILLYTLTNIRSTSEPKKIIVDTGAEEPAPAHESKQYKSKTIHLQPSFSEKGKNPFP